MKKFPYICWFYIAKFKKCKKCPVSVKSNSQDKCLNSLWSPLRYIVWNEMPIIQTPLKYKKINKVVSTQAKIKNLNKY